MMKKAVHITFLCLFFLLGTQCDASNKRNSSFSFLETSQKNLKEYGKSLSKKEFSISQDVFDKLHKKKRLLNPFHNGIARLSKCYTSPLILGAISSSKFIFQENLESLLLFSRHSLNHRFCPKGKVLSIFYSFQAFW